MHRWEVENDARFLTFSCFGRLPLFGNSQIRDAFAERIAWARGHYGFRLIAWVIMPEHVHLFLAARPTGRPDGGTVDQISWGLKKPFSDRVLARWRELRAPVLERVKGDDGAEHFWLPGGGFDRNVRTDDEFNNTVSYTHWNPVTRGLVRRPVDWAWSSARWYAGVREGQIPIDVG
jgi:putative transposase